MKDLRTLHQSRILLLIISLLTLFLMGLGSYVRATGAGLSCPDWPLCFGRAVPPDFGNGVFQEVFHRYVAGIVLTLTATFAFLTFRMRHYLLWPWRFAQILFALLVTQAVMGGLTVLIRLNPFVVTTHLLLGTLFFQIALSAVSYLKASDGQVRHTALLDEEDLPTGKSARAMLPRSLRIGSNLLAALIFLQIVLGGFVGASGASMACPEIPWCYSLIAGPQHLQMTHRILGLSIAGLALLLLVLAYRAPGCSGKVKRLFTVTFGLILAQICLGFANVYFAIPPYVTVMHLVFAQGILAMVVGVIRRLNEGPVVEETRLAFPREMVRSASRS